MKFLRRKDTKSDALPPPPAIPDKPPQLDALPPPPPPLYARFATASSVESLDASTVTPRPNSGTSNPQNRNSVAPSTKTTSTKSSDAPRATVPARPVVKLVPKPRNDTPSTANQSPRTGAPTSPPTPVYRRETSSSESTRLVKARPPSTSNLPNPFLPPLLRQRASGVDITSAASFPTSHNVGTQQALRDATQKRIDLGTPQDAAVQALPPGAMLPHRPPSTSPTSPATSPSSSPIPFAESVSHPVSKVTIASNTKSESTPPQAPTTLAPTPRARPNPIAPTAAINDTSRSPPAAQPAQPVTSLRSLTDPDYRAHLQRSSDIETMNPINRPPTAALPLRDIDPTEPPFVPLKANGPLPMLSNLPSPTSSSVSSPAATSDLSRRVSVTLYDRPVPSFVAPIPDTTPLQIPTPPSSAGGMTTQPPQRRESLPPAPLTPTEPATPRSSKTPPHALNGTRERKTNKLQKSARPASPPPTVAAAAAPAFTSVLTPSRRESMPVASRPVEKRLSSLPVASRPMEKRLSSLQLVTPTHTPTTRASFDTTSMPVKTTAQPPIKPLPASNSFYGAMPTDNIVPNAQLLSPVSPLPGPPRTQSQPIVKVTIKRGHPHPPAPKRADTDPVAFPPTTPEPLPTRSAAPPAQSTSSQIPQRNTSAVHSPAPGPAPTQGPVPGREPENAVDADASSPSRHNSAHNSASAHSMTSASTAPSQVLETPSDLAQEVAQERDRPKSLPQTKSSTSLAKAPSHVEEGVADMDVPVQSARVAKTKSRDGHSLVSRDSRSSHGHEDRHEEEKGKEDGLPPPASKKNEVVQALVQRGEKSQKEDVSGAPAPTATADSPTPSTQQPPAQQPPRSTATPSPAPFKAPPSAARTLLPMHMHSRRRQASSPISKGEVEAARALGVVLYYPLEKHTNDPGLLEELLAYLSFHEFAALSSTSKRIRTRLEDRKELRETVLERFLATVGYVRWEFGIKEPLELTLKDLNSYLRGVSIPVHRYAEIAETALANKSTDGTKSRIVRLLASSTRAYCRVILRLRAQAEAEAMEEVASGKSSRASPDAGSSSNLRPVSPLMRAQMPPRSWKAIFQSPLYRPGHAPLLRVFVPSPEGPWLCDDSVVGCEKELKRAGVLSLLKAGDVVWDTAVSDEACFGNVGRLVWDGNYLIDLDYTFSNAGEVPPYLHSFSFPPSYFHRVLRSAGNPIVQLDIRPWGREVAMNLHLVQDKGHAETPQGGRHVVVRWTHRSKFHVVRNTPIPDTKFTVDPAWEGTIVIECEGTNEGMADLQVRAGLEHFKPQAGVHPQPGDGGRVFRLLREKSRPGEIWIRCVRQKEKII